MRALVVGPLAGGAHMSGAGLRVRAVVDGLAALGDVDVVALRQGAEVAAPPTAARFEAFPWPSPPSGRAGLVRTVIGGRLPTDLSGWAPIGGSDPIGRWIGEADYDVAWFFTPWAWRLAADRVGCHRVLDLYDLEDVRREAEIELRPGLASRSRWRDAPHTGRLRVDARRWTRVYRRMAAEADTVVLCSDEDRARLAAHGVEGHLAVVPNAYPPPVTPVGRAAVGEPPTLCFVGQLRYPPNVDAARRLVERVLPAVRRSLPSTTVRVVGDAGRDVLALGAVDGVTVTGAVERIEPELARADALVVALRFGSGTRLKILEGWAHRIPVVSTTIGAEGLGAVDGGHLLVRDSDEALAAGCVQVLSDVSLRRRLADEGEAHYRRRFTPGQVADLVGGVVAEAAHAGGGR